MLEPVMLAVAAAVPIAVGAWHAPRRGDGIVWGSAVLLGAALASLVAGTGGLEREAWRGYALAVPGGQAFIAAGVGGMLAAAAAASGRGVWAAPLAVVVTLGLRETLRSPAVLAGAAVVVALLAFGAGWGRARAAVRPAGTTTPPWPLLDRVLLIAVVGLFLAGGPIVLALPAMVLLTWRTHAARRATVWWAIPVVVTLFSGTVLWLLMTVAGTPWAMLATARTEIPLSAAAERLVGNLWVALVIVLGGSWPLGRRGLALRAAPAAVALAFAGATMLSPDGIAAWRPLATLLLVPAALAAGVRRDLAGLTGALASLAALDGSPLGSAAALLLLAWPMAGRAGLGNPDGGERVTLHAARIGGIALALGFALAMLVILPDEVLLGTVLAAGLGLLLPAWGGGLASR